MKLSKKIVTIATIISTCVVSLLLILLLFGTKLFGDSNLKMLITFVSLGIGGFFAINSMNMLGKNKVIGLISLGLIIASVVLILLSTWISLGNEVYAKIMFSLGLLSVLFNIIVSSSLNLGRNKMIWQILVYIVVAITDLIATLSIFGVIDLGEVIPWFLTLIILSIFGVIILKVFSKKTLSDMIETEKDIVKISKKEYDMLLEKASKYDEIISNQKD